MRQASRLKGKVTMKFYLASMAVFISALLAVVFTALASIGEDCAGWAVALCVLLAVAVAVWVKSV